MIISRDLNELHHDIKMKAVQLLEDCKNAGIDILITCTYRDDEAQNWIYASGRTRKGKVLTNARAGESKHNHRKAFDFVVMVGGKCDWNDASAYERVGAMGEKIGLKWAGRWRGKLKELVHFEI